MASNDSIQDAITATIQARRAEYDDRGDGTLALCVATVVRTNHRWTAHLNDTCMRDVYRTDLAEAAPGEGTPEEANLMNTLTNKYTDELVRIMTQCQLHATVVNKRLEFQTMLEQLENVRFEVKGTDRAVKRTGPAFVEAMPSDCWATIAEFLSFQDIMHLPVVSRQLFDDRDFVTWNTLYHRCFGGGVPLNDGSSWCREFKAKVVPMVSATYDQHHGGIPSVSKFLDDVAPKGSFNLGNKNLLITRTDPIRMIQAARHGSQTVKLEVDELPTSRGPVVVISVAYNADGFKRGLSFESFASPKMAVQLRKAVAAVQHFDGSSAAK